MRMEILDEHVTHFLVSECDRTFQCGTKEFNFEKNKDQFEKWNHKIIYNKFMDRVGDKWDNWDRDKNHKNAIARGLEGIAEEDSIIILSDCDEIPALDRHNIQDIYNPDKLVVMEQKFYYYYLNYMKIETWYGSRICSYKMFKEHNFDALRNMKEDIIKIPDGGWHFSFLSDIEGIKTKIKSWGHVEYSVPWVLDNVEANVKSGRDIFARGDSQFKQVHIDESYPKYILDNLDKYSQFILK